MIFGRQQRMSEDPLVVAGFREPTIIGSGSASAVYAATDRTLKRAVAVKVVSRTLSDGKDREQFERDLQVASALGAHPRIVTLHRSGVLRDGRPFVAMELCNGGSIASIVSEHGPLPPHTALDLTIAIAGALQSAHDGGVIHGTLSPEKLLLRQPDEPILSGFEAASRAAEVTTEVEGTPPAYAATEVLMGERATALSDQYSLAMTLHFLLAGAPPFERRLGESLPAARLRALQDPLPTLVRADLPIGLWPILLRATAKEQNDRYSSVKSFARGLQDVQREAGWPVTPVNTIDLNNAPVAESAPASRLAATAAGSFDIPPTSPSPDGLAALRESGQVGSAKRPTGKWLGAGVATLALITTAVLALTQGDNGDKASSLTTTTLANAPIADPTTTLTEVVTTIANADQFRPINVRLTADTGDSVDLQWTDPAGGVVPYVIDITIEGESVSPVQVADTSTTATLDELESGEPYCFSVGAVYAIGTAPAYATPVCRTS